MQLIAVLALEIHDPLPIGGGEAGAQRGGPVQLARTCHELSRKSTISKKFPVFPLAARRGGTGPSKWDPSAQS